ncbi:MAG: chemotaxis protein CheA [Desulfococcaceae bacterium]
MPDYADTFRQEAEEVLAEIETDLLALAERPDAPELINQVFRAVHTLKGSGAMFGSEPVVALAHELETVLDRVREGAIPADRELVNLGLKVRDALARLVAGEAAEAEAEELSRVLRNQMNGSGRRAPLPPALPLEGHRRTFRVAVRPCPDLLINGTRPLLLLDELRGLGTCEVQVRRERVPALADLDPERCYLAWDLWLTTEQDANAIRDVFIFAEDRCRVALSEIDANGRIRRRLVFGGDAESDGDPSPATFADDLFPAQAPSEMAEPMAEPMKDALHRDSFSEPFSDFLGEADAPEGEGEAFGLVPKTEDPPTTPRDRATVRVPAERLDALVDLVGELVTVQAGLSRLARRAEEPELNRLAEAVERLTADLRDTTIRVRMTPLGTAFNRLRRLVHDLSDRLGKPATLRTAGGETELDKSVMEGLLDPMVHLLRNCLDHGIEPPAERKAAGKPETGRISISARHAGGSVAIRIADDGAGIDAEAVRKRAVARNMLPSDARPDPDTLFRLIFEPGFSTRETAGTLSGRGVGLDVVRDRVEALRGRIEVTSRPGEGTAFLLTLPLTLAIIEGLLVNVGGVRYVLPLAAVEECMEAPVSGPDGPPGDGLDGLVRVRDAALARVSLRDLFRVNGTRPENDQLVIVRAGDRRAALAVDEVIGDHQTVIKSLGAVYRRARVYSGATVLDDGRVALILDPQRLVETAEAEQFSEGGGAGSWLSPS